MLTVKISFWGFFEFHILFFCLFYAKHSVLLASLKNLQKDIIEIFREIEESLEDNDTVMIHKVCTKLTMTVCFLL